MAILVELQKDAQVLGEGHRKEQPSIGHQAVVIEGDLNAVGVLKWQPLSGAPCFWLLSCSKNHYPRSAGAPSCRFRILTRRSPSVDSGLVSFGEFYLPWSVSSGTGDIFLSRKQASLKVFNVELCLCREGLGLVSSIDTCELEAELSVSAVVDFSSYWSRSGSERPDYYRAFAKTCPVREGAFRLS